MGKNSTTATSLEDVMSASSVTTVIAETVTTEGAQGGEAQGTAEQAAETTTTDAGNSGDNNGTADVNGDTSAAGASAGDAGDGDGNGIDNGGSNDAGANATQMTAEENAEFERLLAEEAAHAALPAEPEEAPAQSFAEAVTEAVEEMATEAETVEVELTDEERLPWLYNYGENRLPGTQRNTRALWHGFCIDFPDMLGYANMSPDVSLIPQRHRALFESRTVDPSEYSEDDGE